MTLFLAKYLSNYFYYTLNLKTENIFWNLIRTQLKGNINLYICGIKINPVNKTLFLIHMWNIIHLDNYSSNMHKNLVEI